MFLAWALLGALIGVAAAQRKGFSMVGGVLGGLLLGPLAFLMFFASGVSATDKNKKCPYCAEFVKADATICKHCHKELPPAAVVKYGAGTVRDSGTRPPAIRPEPGQRRPPARPAAQ
jgi:hypothetical protein